MPTNAPIEKLDPNFQSPAINDGMEWHDAHALRLEGSYWPTESEVFCRLPDRAEELVPEAVWNLSRFSAGLRIRFLSNTTKLAARWSLRQDALAMPHMPATGVSGLDLYARDGAEWRWAGIARASRVPTNEEILFEDDAGVEREWLLYLPLYNGVTELRIGVPRGASIRPAAADLRKPVCFYGTSIVQGGCASRPGLAYAAILGRMLDCPILNLGFSGNGRAEPEVAALLAEVDASIHVIDPLPNMQPPQILDRIGPLVRTIRTAHPDTPVVLVENIVYQQAWLTRARLEIQTAKNDALQTVYRQLQQEGVKKLYCVPGASLLGNDGEGTVDGTHPNDLGFQRMAEAMAPLLRSLLPTPTAGTGGDPAAF